MSNVFTNLKTAGGAVFKKAALQLKDKAPEILVGVGVVSVVAGVVLACKATLEIDKQKDEIKAEVEETIDSAKAKMEEIDDGVEDETLASYDEERAAKDKAIVYTRSAGAVIKSGAKVAKAYAPAAGLIVAGLACILLSHKILRDRNAALLTAYTALDSAFKAYRQRVLKEGGQELDHKYLYGTKTEMKEVKRINSETGLEETVVEAQEVIDYPLGSPYARIFDKKHSVCFEDADPNLDWNISWLTRAESWANDKLHNDGFLYLNEVYKYLGLKQSVAGQYVGWSMDNPDGDHDVHFDIMKSWEDPRFKNFIEPGRFRRLIVLDFNVDGVIDQWVMNNKYFTNLDNDLDKDDYELLVEMDERAEMGNAAYEMAEVERYARLNK